jgi:hypothetical protein
MTKTLSTDAPDTLDSWLDHNPWDQDYEQAYADHAEATYDPDCDPWIGQS